MNRPKGTKDIFGRREDIREYVLNTVRTVAQVYNFQKIETPIFERKEVFVRSVGETSDIVSKEMYDFEDKKGRSMTLRPEGTAGTIRAIVENKLYAEALPLKVFYTGPMFRYENPQKGRQRQFTQFGVEMIAEKSPYLDAEVIFMGKTILDSLGIKFELVLNSLGDNETRESYSKALRTYLEGFKDQLTSDSINRLDKNPMRILDDKVDGEKDFVKNAPKINEFYNEETRAYFAEVTDFLSAMGVAYTVDTNLVRGLDYYTDTAFEFKSVSDAAGSQSTIIGGGRYSKLVKEFGGPDLSGIGFGLGIERLVNDVEVILEGKEVAPKPHAYVLNIAPEFQKETLALVLQLRGVGFIVEWNNKPAKLSKAFDKAAKSGAIANIIAGAKELAENKVNVKVNGKQVTVDMQNLAPTLDQMIQEAQSSNGSSCEDPSCADPACDEKPKGETCEHEGSTGEILLDGGCCGPQNIEVPEDKKLK